MGPAFGEELRVQPLEVADVEAVEGPTSELAYSSCSRSERPIMLSSTAFVTSMPRARSALINARLIASSSK